LRGLGEVERLVGEYGQAREYHTEALALARHPVTDLVKSTRCGDWARLSGSLVSTARPASTTRKPWLRPRPWLSTR
jgi:hypothetical protein